MSRQALVGVLRALLLVIGLPLAVAGLRLALDAMVRPQGWNIVPFLAVFIAARLGGLKVAAAVTFAVAALHLLDPAAPGWLRPGDRALVADLVLDLAAGALAMGLAVAMRDAGSRARASDRAATRTAVRLVGAARREAAARRLAAVLTTPLSIRQIADRFAAEARDMLDATGVVVSAIGATGRAAGGPSGAPLAGAGVTPEGAAIADALDEAATRGRPVARTASGAAEDDRAVGVVAAPLLAGAGAAAAAAAVLDPARAVDDEELEGLLLLGRIAGEAMARAELGVVSRREGGRARAAAARIARLQDLAAALGRELDAGAIARTVVDAATDGTASSVGVLSRVDPERRELDLLHARGYPVGLLDRERRLPLDGGTLAPTVARTGRTVVVDAASWSARFPGASDLPAMAGLGELVALPVGGASPVAVLVVGRGSDEPFDGDSLGFLEAVAEHAAQALRRAALVDLLGDRDRRLGLTLGVARAGSWELDVETGRLEVSAELRRLYGVPDAAAADGLEAYLERIHPDDREAVRGAVRGTAAGGGPFTVEFRVTRPDGSVLRMLGVGRTFHDRLGRPTRLMAIDRDVTAERQAEAERERLLEQEREARRLSEAFFGVMSHELRTPVTTIIAGARLVSRAEGLSAADRELVEDIAAESDRLHRLIEDLLVLSRIERGNLVLASEPVHVGHLVRRVVEHEARRWPETRFRLPGQLARAVIDGEETYVEQVLRNLLSNAAKYSPVGSVVEVCVDVDGDEVAIRVLDQGAGIGPDELGDLFTLFYRSPSTAAAASGAGIGLFVCDRLVRAMGGRIWARTRPEGGSEFGFALRTVADDEPSESDDRPAPLGSSAPV